MLRLPNECSELYPLNAMRDAGVRIDAINLSRGYVAFANGLCVPILNMLDAEGRPTDDPEDCWRIEFGTSDLGLGSVGIAHVRSRGDH